MKTNKEEIVREALSLFAAEGYEGTSMSMIAGRIGITKGALYRHFENKQQIFNSIIEKMYELDDERAREEKVPEEDYEKNPKEYENLEADDFFRFTIDQMKFWTENSFASDVRRMLTLEQFRSKEMNSLYQKIVCVGPVEYTRKFLEEMKRRGELKEDAEKIGTDALAIMLFAPLHLCIQMADGGADKDKLNCELKKILEDFREKWIR